MRIRLVCQTRIDGLLHAPGVVLLVGRRFALQLIQKGYAEPYQPAEQAVLEAPEKR